MSQKQLNQMTFKPTSQKKAMTYLLLLLLKTLITRSKTLFSQIHLNKQILSQFTNKIPGMKRKSADLYAFYPTYLKFMSVACIHR